MNPSLENTVKTGAGIIEYYVNDIAKHVYERGVNEGIEAYSNALKTLIHADNTAHSFADEVVTLLSMDAIDVLELAKQRNEHKGW